ncbi:MAG: tubulin-like doman-containing protein [Gemmataceae bacterium]
MSVRAESNAEPIPGYRLIERLGGGGFGEVWKCEAPGGMHKAIKFVYGDLSSGGDSDQRAKQELKALERVRDVRHPYILSLERYEVIDGQLLIVMELADRNLWDRYKECRAQGLPGISRGELLHYMREAAEALDMMNQDCQLQHLDIKPQNIFLVSGHVKVADFGLVKDLEGSQASVTGGITPVYAAPETFDGKVTRFSDQYSLAIVYQELLTGQRPFNGVNVRQLILQHISASPNVTPLPPGDQAAIARGLAKRPEDRFPTCRDLVQVLLTAGAEGASAAPPRAESRPAAHPPVVPNDWQPAPPSALTSGSLSAGLVTANIRAVQTPEPASNQGTTDSLRPAEPVILHEKDAPARVAPPEVNGPGALFPALVIGLGQTGLSVLQHFRDTLQTFVAPPGQLPHLRHLLIDTDVEVMRAATRESAAGQLTAGEVLLTPLNRPSYYLKPRDGRVPFQSWLNPRMLYRIPRSQVTTGVRALGRLAFCDHFRAIVRRLQLELEAVLDPEAVAASARLTELGVRSNRPRVYIITGLAGGTGSGMFIDLAYTVRALLRQMGYDSPDVVSVLLLPPLDTSRTRVMAVGNTYAALTELTHFSAPTTTFRGKYHEREATFEDADPPFSRNIVLPLPDESDEVATQEVIDLCSQFLYRDLTTSFGRTADHARADLMAPVWEARGQYFQTFNLFHLSWPRHALVSTLSRRLCQRLVARWGTKDSKPLQEMVQQRIHERWTEGGLTSDRFIERLQDEVNRELGTTMEQQFAAVIQAIAARSAQGQPRAGRTSEPAVDPVRLAAVLAELEALVGRPGESPPADEPPLLVRLSQEKADLLAHEWSQRRAELSVQMIEEPAFRLAGAEEAIRQMVASIEQVLQQHEPLTKELTEKAVRTYERLRTLADPARPPLPRSVPLTAAQVQEWLHGYPKWRVQSLILQRLAGTFVALRGHLSDELREVNFCRVRLTELGRLFEAPLPDELPLSPASEKGMAEKHIGKRLLPAGCDSLAEVVELYLREFTPESVLELDGRMEEMLKSSFTALVNVCLSGAHLLKPVQTAMLAVARAFVAEHLPPTSVTELFFERYPDDEAIAELAACYSEATPEIAILRSRRVGPALAELCVLAAPQDDNAAQLAEAFHAAVPDVEVVATTSPEDILVYRERGNLALADLEHLGPLGHDAYLKMNSSDNFTPHARTDVSFTPK